jgi:predicted  nucleic acid-binding Zn-ribbon protein
MPVKGELLAQWMCANCGRIWSKGNSWQRCPKCGDFPRRPLGHEKIREHYKPSGSSKRS